MFSRYHACQPCCPNPNSESSMPLPGPGPEEPLVGPKSHAMRTPPSPCRLAHGTLKFRGHLAHGTLKFRGQLLCRLLGDLKGFVRRRGRALPTRHRRRCTTEVRLLARGCTGTPAASLLLRLVRVALAPADCVQRARSFGVLPPPPPGEEEETHNHRMWEHRAANIMSHDDPR